MDQEQYIRIIGEEMKQARTSARMTLEELGQAVRRSASSLHEVENGKTKNPPTVFDVIDTARATRSPQLNVKYCRLCPIRSEIIPPKFIPLNNIDKHPGIMAYKVAEKIAEGAEALPRLIRALSRKDFASTPDFDDILHDAMFSMMSMSRGIEEIKNEFLERGALTQESLRMLRISHDQHCVRNGHLILEEG